MNTIAIDWEAFKLAELERFGVDDKDFPLLETRCVCGQLPASQKFRVGPTGRKSNKNISCLCQVCRCGRLYPLPNQQFLDGQQEWVNRWNRRIELNEQRQCQDSE